MKIVDAKNVPVMENVHNVRAGAIYNTERAMAVHITLEAGEKLKPHITPVDVFSMFWRESQPLKLARKGRQSLLIT